MSFTNIQFDMNASSSHYITTSCVYVRVYVQKQQCKININHNFISVIHFSVGKSKNFITISEMPNLDILLDQVY